MFTQSLRMLKTGIHGFNWLPGAPPATRCVPSGQSLMHGTHACPSDTTFAQVTIVLGIDLPTQILMSNSNLTISRIL
ncbi:hypothetical protein PCANC_15503 [Puccinia coronata f. sp. avenae]|uniref:Uncharacterized protein n=1 Tax=Puccinia coronata f. sp. avenae TaxID=200324 RepID=A0A2N5UFR3_9BASI|nr:hypothetical protein PCANC_15503 [Puccinia coronata f. sp. avenae]